MVNFENTVIVMTSNAGSDIKGGSLGFDRTANQLGRDKAMKGLESFLRPEFINRVDEIVYFNPLTEDNFKAIARIMLSELEGVLRDKNITFHYDELVLDYLVRKSFSPPTALGTCAARSSGTWRIPLPPSSSSGTPTPSLWSTCPPKATS